jgi:hypothetical protein
LGQQPSVEIMDKSDVKEAKRQWCPKVEFIYAIPNNNTPSSTATTGSLQVSKLLTLATTKVQREGYGAVRADGYEYCIKIAETTPEVREAGTRPINTTFKSITQYSWQ